MARVTRSQTAKSNPTTKDSSTTVTGKRQPPKRQDPKQRVKASKKSKSTAQSTPTPKAASCRPARIPNSTNLKEVAKNNPPPRSFEIPFTTKPIQCEFHQHSSKAGESFSLIFTHGAGGGISTPATQDFARGFATDSPILLYQGTMNLPNRVKACQAVIERVGWSAALGGRSMGARAAAVAAAETPGTEAVVLVSYPLIGGKEGTDVRDRILLDLPERVDVLFVIGSLDMMCPLEHLGAVRKQMKARSWLVVVESADHGMSVSPKAASEGIRMQTGAVAAAWLRERDVEKRMYSMRWDGEDGKAESEGWVDGG